jgi:hypothetical protein
MASQNLGRRMAMSRKLDFDVVACLSCPMRLPSRCKHPESPEDGDILCDEVWADGFPGQCPLKEED